MTDYLHLTEEIELQACDELIHLALTRKKSPAGRRIQLDAIREILDRKNGRATQRIQATVHKVQTLLVKVEDLQAIGRTPEALALPEPGAHLLTQELLSPDRSIDRSTIATPAPPLSREAESDSTPPSPNT